VQADILMQYNLLVRLHGGCGALENTGY